MFYSTFCFNGLRIDEQEFIKLDKASITELAPLYQAINLKLSSKSIKKNKYMQSVTSCLFQNILLHQVL